MVRAGLGLAVIALDGTWCDPGRSGVCALRKAIVADDQGVELDDSGPIHRYCVYGFVFGRDAA